MLVFTKDAWQLAGASAVAVNETLTYVLVKHKGEYLILAEKRLGEFISRIDQVPGEPPFKTLLAFGGETLAGMKIENPLKSPDRSPQLEVVVYNNLKPTFGTGLSTVTPAHDIDDLRISYAHNLDRLGAVDAETGFLSNTILTEGKDLSPMLEHDHAKIISAIKLALGKSLFTNYKH